METKLVYFKNGDYIVVSDGVTWEYENDADWCKTVSIQKLIKKIRKGINQLEKMITAHKLLTP